MASGKPEGHARMAANALDANGAGGPSRDISKDTFIIFAGRYAGFKAVRRLSLSISPRCLLH